MPEMTDYSAKELLTIANREQFLDNSDLDELLTFISAQIANPFESSESNYFRRIHRMVTHNGKTTGKQARDQMNEICFKIIRMIDYAYPNIEFVIDPSEQDLVEITKALYKFFVKCLRKTTYVFFREFIYNNKNRKNILEEYQDIHVASFPKEIFGKKEYYILTVKMASIVKNLAEKDFSLEKYIKYITRDGSMPNYVRIVSDGLDDNTIVDHGVFSDMMEKMLNSDSFFNRMVSGLMGDVKTAIINPYLESIGIDPTQYPTTDLSDDIDIDDDDRNDPDITEEPDYNPTPANTFQV